MRLTDAELTAILAWGHGKPDTACLALSYREVRAMIEEIRQHRHRDVESGLGSRESDDLGSKATRRPSTEIVA